MNVQNTVSQKVAQAILRSGLRGRTRMTLALSHLSNSLQCAPVSTADGDTLFLDLRVASSHGLFSGERLEQSERLIMKKCVSEGDVVIDVGAHWGLHTTLLSSLVGPSGSVFAFEPNRTIARLLRRTVATMGNVTVDESALSNEEGEFDFYVPLDASMGSLQNWTQGEVVENYKCSTCRLEDLIASGMPRPSFIKCDIEGGELRFFEGAASILTHVHAPTILFEENGAAALAFGEEPNAAAEFLTNLDGADYQVFVIGSGGALLPTAAPADTDSVRSLLAVPATRLAGLV
jgi:FkbM family methyltransferase